MHDAYIALADFQAARALLDSHSEAFKEERFRVALKLAHDLHILAQGGYRLSEEEQAGYSIDETTDTDIDGAFRIESVPPGLHDFIAVTLDPERWGIATRFLARQIDVPENAFCRARRAKIILSSIFFNSWTERDL